MQVYATLKETGLRHWLFSADDPELDEGVGAAFWEYRHIAPVGTSPPPPGAGVEAGVGGAVGVATEEEEEDDDSDDDDDEE